MNARNTLFRSESGNAMIYVIIIIALFAALSFLLSRQSDTGESGTVSRERVNIAATQIMQNAASLQAAIEQMTYTGARLADLDFIPPSDGSFEDGGDSLKVFHPDGGGVTLPKLPTDAIHEVSSTPGAGWYIGRFNNIEWSAPDANGDPLEDVVIVAYQISKAVCERINQQLTGDPALPVLSGTASKFFIEAPRYHAGPNEDFETADCTGRSCEGVPALCVENSTHDSWSFYSLVLAQPQP
jgi:hypothetical protein